MACTAVNATLNPVLFSSNQTNRLLHLCSPACCRCELWQLLLQTSPLTGLWVLLTSATINGDLKHPPFHASPQDVSVGEPSELVVRSFSWLTKEVALPVIWAVILNVAYCMSRNTLTAPKLQVRGTPT